MFSILNAQHDRGAGVASRVFGASERRTFIRVLLPIALAALAAVWAILLILTAGE